MAPDPDKNVIVPADVVSETYAFKFPDGLGTRILMRIAPGQERNHEAQAKDRFRYVFDFHIHAFIVP